MFLNPCKPIFSSVIRRHLCCKSTCASGATYQRPNASYGKPVVLQIHSVSYCCYNPCTSCFEINNSIGMTYRHVIPSRLWALWNHALPLAILLSSACGFETFTLFRTDPFAKPPEDLRHLPSASLVSRLRLHSSPREWTPVFGNDEQPPEQSS